MRRLFSSLMALGLFGAVLGCHHVTGVCDCYFHESGYSAYAPAATAPKPEPAKETPKETGKTPEKIAPPKEIN